MERSDAVSNGLIGLLRKSSSCNQPWQIAAAMVLGCASGCLPKYNLLFPLSLAALYVLPVHLPVAVVAMLGCSLVAPWIQPLQGSIGVWLFQDERVVSFIERFDRVPLAQWFRLHNTVVTGSVSLSATVAVPLYLIAHRAMLVYYTAWMASESRKNFEDEMLRKRGAMNSLIIPTVTLTESKSSNQRPEIVAPNVEPRPLAAPHFEPSKESVIDSIYALESLLEQATVDQPEKIDTESILSRASKAVELVDDLVHMLETDLTHRVDSDHHVQSFRAHDTVISLSRSKASVEATGLTEQIQSGNNFFPATESMIRTAHSPVVKLPIPKHRIGIVGDADSVAQAHETATRNVEIRHEEALRHLLNHLRNISEEVK